MRENIKENIFFNSYLDTFSHYGVAGMKWGVWNDETQRKYRGGVSGIDSKLSNKNLDVKTSDYTDAAKSMKADLKAANLGGKFVSYFKKDRYANTGYCTAAYLLRKSGYDVAAKTSKISATPQDIQKLYKNPKVDVKTNNASPESIAMLKNKLASQGEGASGFLIGSYKNSDKNGRVLAYTIANGKVNIIDGQTGKIHSTNIGINNSLKHFGGMQTVRTDNKSVDDKYAQKVAGSTSLLKVTDNKLDKVKIAVTSAKVIAASVSIGSTIINATYAYPAREAMINNTMAGKLKELMENLPVYNSGEAEKFIGDITNKFGKNSGKIKEVANAMGSEYNEAVKKAKKTAREYAIKELESNTQFRDLTNLHRQLSTTAVEGAMATIALGLGTKVNDIVRLRSGTNGTKDPTKTKDKAYEKAARNYLKEHPNSNMSVAELAAKYKKEWTEGNK